MCSTDLKHGTSRKKCQGGACHQERNVRTWNIIPSLFIVV